MTNVVAFPGRVVPCSRAHAASLEDAVWMAVILVKGWHESTEEVVLGLAPVLGDAFPEQPRIILDSIELSATGVTEHAALHRGSCALPAPLSLFLNLWNEDPDNPIETYSDAAEFVEAIIYITRDQQDRFLARRGGAS